jgi:adenosylhomocysteine nucleosidase
MRIAIFFLAGRVFCADLLVQGAIEPELTPLLSALQGKQEVHVAAWTFWTGRIGKKSVVISRTEIGPINAAAATALGIERFHPAAILNQGTAGASNPDLALWDIVIGEKTTDYGAFRAEHGDAGAGIDPARWTPLIHSLRLDGAKLRAFPSFPGDAQLMAAAFAVKYQRGKLRKGNIGSAYQYNRELDRIQWMRKTYGIDTEDMESAFSAGVATGMNVPFLAIRIVSDSEWSHPAFEKIAGEYCAQFTVDLIRAMR